MPFAGTHRWMLSIFAAWIVGSVGGLLMLLDYKSTPGPESLVPLRWPPSASVTRPDGSAILLMFAHPRCPCTRASLHELAVIMGHRREEPMKSRIVFQVPDSAPADWQESDIVRQAQEIGGVEIVWDHDGCLAAQFGARTSGHVVLYDQQGDLVFSGGITGLRGHEGDNTGRNIVLAFPHNRPDAALHTPIFGCSLFGTNETAGRSDSRTAK